MESKVDVLVIGGGPAGIVSAITARKYYPEKRIVVMKNIEKGVIPCGIPYMFASLKNPEENKLGNAPLENNNIEVIVDEAKYLDRSNKTVYTQSNNAYHYEKLIIATGSHPVLPPIPGISKKGVYPILKDMKR